MKFKKDSTDDQKKLYVTLTNNWTQYTSLLEKIQDTELKNASLAMAKNISDRLIVCPASSKVEYVGCFPGGLVWHSLNVHRNFEVMRNTLDLKSQVSSDSAIVLSLFHDIGKLGTEDEDFYHPQNSEWHREKLGQMFTINNEIANLSGAARTLEWLSRFSVSLSATQIQAIISATNASASEHNNSVNNNKDSWESFLLQAAIKASCLNSPNVASILDIE